MAADEEIPKVCVLMTVYNHGRWVAQAIDSVLRQQTDFTYKLLISEDCSTDNSREIVKEYKVRYPERIELLLSEHNLGMAGNGRKIMAHARGKYIACCEGDDFWTDPKKLQIQVDFLDSHPEYAACYHAVKIIDENGKERDLQIEAYTGILEYDYPLDWAGSLRLPGQSCSCVYRHNAEKMMSEEMLEAYEACRMNGDQKNVIVYLAQGKIRRMARCMACYRRTYMGDSWNARTHGKEMADFSYIGYLEIEKFANLCLPIRVNRHPEARLILQNFLRGFKNNKNTNKYGALWRIFAYSPGLFIKFAFIDKLAYLLRQLMRSLLIRWERDRLRNWARPHYIIFGAGDIGGRCLALMKLAGLSGRIDCIWDNDRHKAGMKIDGHELRRPEWKLTAQETMVIIATASYMQEMRKQMEDMGLVYGRDMLSYDDFCKQLEEEVIKSEHPYIYKAFCNE